MAHFEGSGPASTSIGAIIPNSGAGAWRLQPADMARIAAEAGAEGLWLSDHLLIVDTPVNAYPTATTDDSRGTWQATTVRH